jgi:chromate transporter
MRGILNLIASNNLCLRMPKNILILGNNKPMNFKLYSSFLQSVLKHSLTAFGGPQVHVGLLQRRFVEQRRDITNEELLEYNAFCQLLPGASSTQTIVLVAYKKGGILLAFLTLLVWALPATIIMASVAIAYTYFNFQKALISLQYLQPMSIGFIASATLLLYKKAIKSTITKYIFILTSLLVIIGFKSPWTIPIIIVLAGIATNFSKKRIPKDGDAPKKIQWSGFLVFISLFIVAGILSEQSTRNNWKYQKIFNLFETNYRFGSFVFGGGDVLIPMMYEQYVTRPLAPRVLKNKRDVIKISSDAFLTGSGIVRAVPGPIFSIAPYTGAMALKDKGISWQIAGAIVASLGVFLPSFFIVLFFFPIWQILKRFAIFYRSLEGIHAAVVGIMFGATLYLSKDVSQNIANSNLWVWFLSGLIFLGSTFLIYHKKLGTHWIVLLVILMGFISSYLPNY